LSSSEDLGPGGGDTGSDPGELTLFDAEELVTSGPTGPLVRVRLTLAYDGSSYSGIAPNPGVKTVGGTLVMSLQRVLRVPVVLALAGRTDAGVHAWGQVVSFDAPAEGFDAAALQRSLNKLCGPTIVVRSVEVVDPRFDARHSARSRRYRYTILNTPTPSPFTAGTTWHVPEPLDLAMLRLGCDPFYGEHDFTSFCRKPKVPEGVSYTMTRRVLDATWRDLGDGLLRFDVEATAFCQQMVRTMVGTLVECGLGKRTVADISAALRGADRTLAGPPAPPHGLCLWEVVY
jgi:tRNA pseudouridine38-40 synthase